MLTYLVQVTEGLLMAAVLVGMLMGFARVRWDKSEMRVVEGGLLAGILAAVLLAVLKNTTKLVDSGLWNLRFVGIYCIGLLLLLVLLIPALAQRAGKVGERVQQVGVAMLLIGALGYLAPESMGYPATMMLSVKSVISSDYFFRMVGWICGVVMMVVLAMAMSRVLVALERPIATVVPVAGSIFCGTVLVGLAVRALITRRLIPTAQVLMKIAVFASNNNLLFCCVMGAMALVCVIALLVRSAHVQEPYANPAEHRKIRAKWRSRRRWSAAAICCLVLALVTLTAIKAYDSREVELSPSEDFELRDDGCYIALEQVEDGHLHRFTYTTKDDVGIRFIIIRKPGGSAYGIGLDACDICGETGYYERDDQVVCKLCDVVMNVQTIGFKGGCNPIVIDYEIKDGYIIIPFDTLLEHEDIFTR